MQGGFPHNRASRIQGEERTLVAKRCVHLKHLPSQELEESFFVLYGGTLMALMASNSPNLECFSENPSCVHIPVYAPIETDF